MRKQIFLAIAQRIKEQVPEIKFIDLWNEHVADITNNTAWPTPSLFVEFEPYDVRPESRHCAMADIPVRLHVVTRAVAYTESDPKAAMELGDSATEAAKQQIFRFNAGKEMQLFPPKHPYFKAPAAAKKVVQEDRKSVV